MKKFAIFLIISLFFICVFALLFVQLVLITPKGREIVGNIQGGQTVSTNAGAVASEITLTLTGAPPSPNIKILQDGVKIATFDKTPLTITAIDNSLIEIDGTASIDPFTVTLQNISPNAEISGKSVAVHGNIGVLGRILIN